ncbi:MAG: hypothetical protein GXO60_03080, partial [Epsilonproteobacteria bacterium]|nr:hypothetical protein [Campylobacterota bacterium]
MNNLKKLLISIFIFIMSMVLLNYLYPLDIDRLQKPKSTQIYDRNNKLLTIKL